MKKTLIVFNTSLFDLKNLPGREEKICLFPLSADKDVIDAALRKFRKSGVSCDVIDSAVLVRNEIENFRKPFIEWAAATGTVNLGGKTLRQRLMLGDSGMSAWWFSLLADKDPSKSDIFLRIVQTEAILKYAGENDISKVLLAIDDNDYLRTLRTALEEHSMEFQSLRTRRVSKQKRSFLKRLTFLRLLSAFIKETAKIIYVKLKMPSLVTRERRFNDALLFVTYFPALIGEPAEQGLFSNRLAYPLQALCKDKGKAIVWILMYANYDNHKLSDALGLAKRYIEHDENMFFIEEFCTIRNIFEAALEFAIICFRWLTVRSGLVRKLYTDKIVPSKYAANLFSSVIDGSIFSYHLYDGILRYTIFKNMFKTITGFSHGLYYCEMLAWEYALLSAKKATRATYPVIGYQHAGISTNYLQMFHTKQEYGSNEADALPLPDIFAVNGNVSRKMLGEYYGAVTNVEALRYLYINKYLDSDPGTNVVGDKFILLVCTSIDPKESLTFVNLVDSAYHCRADGIEIWFKCHPTLPFKSIISGNTKPLSLSYSVKEGNISELLKQCNAVLVGASTVSIEALAFGCDVLVYENAEVLNQSPLIGYDEYCYRITAPQGLRDTIDMIRSGKLVTNKKKKRDFVRQYWNLAPSLDGWKKLLELQ